MTSATENPRPSSSFDSDVSPRENPRAAPSRSLWVVSPEVASYFVAGGCAGAASRTVVSPLERLKIIQQVQPRGSDSQYKGVWRSLLRMWQEEGFKGFMRGNGINCLRIVPYSAVQFTTYEQLKKWFTRHGSKELDTPKRLASGALAGITSVCSTYPLDLVRSRLSIATASVPLVAPAAAAGLKIAAVSIPLSQATHAAYHTAVPAIYTKADLTIWGMTSKIVREEGGVKGLYRGLVTTAVGVAPYVGINFAAYEFLRGIITPPGKGSVARKLSCGALAGCISQTLTYPFDVLRRKMQVSGMQGGSNKYSGAIDALRSILGVEGVSGLYRGLWPNLLKVAPSIATSFFTYELVKDHHAAGGPCPGGPSSFHPGACSNIGSLSPPSHPMGSSHSKATSSSVAFKGIVAGGIKIKRAFATKKKRQEDLSAEHDSPLPLSSALSSSSAPTPLLNITAKRSVVHHHQQPSSPPPPPTPPKHDIPSPLNAEQPTRTQSLNRASVLPISPGISPAVNYILQQQTPPVAAPQPQQSAPEAEKPPEKEPENVKQTGAADNMLDKRETKETWRKSDSTNSHHTVRPGGGSTRPVSWAESFQSTHTIVQVSNKRLSALITDGMPEEDDESFISVGDNLSCHPSKSTPPSSMRIKSRRSMSLGTPSTISKMPIPPVTDPTTLSNTQFTTSPTYHAFTTSIDIGADQQSMPSNIRERFAAWTAANTNSSSDNLSRQERTLPALPPQQRQSSLSQRVGDAGGGGTSPSSSTAISLRQTAISGLGPAAAGLAKRAVEKMGRKWGMGLSPSTSGSGSGSGSGYSSSSSSTNAPSSFSSASHTDYGLVRTNSNQSTPSVHSHIVKSSHSHGSAVGLARGGKRRTPDASSGAYSVHSVASNSDNDAFAPPSGPILGTLLRGRLNSKNGVPFTGGVVFGRDLVTVTRETGMNVGKEKGSVGVDGGGMKDGLVLELEGRLLPAIVVRCAQHLLIWGVQEEGLFRVNGHPYHVSKLRSEFDSGVDYDMTECSPGDLDPHAVASVFKAYLRELPESILTKAFSPFFDGAIKKEASNHLPEQNRILGGGNDNGLPQGGFIVRKTPSLSMPNFSGIPPPSTSLVADIKSLISQLPRENHDLLRTVVDLIKATGKESKKTKMPLSNLLLVFCPSLNMTPPLLKVFCETEGIWVDRHKRAELDSPPPPLPMKDGQIAKEEEAEMSDEDQEVDDEDQVLEEKSLMSSGRASLDTTDDPSSGYHASEEEEASLFEESPVVRKRWVSERNTKRSEIPTVYLDTRSHYSSSSASSLRESLEPSGRHHHMNSQDGLVVADEDGSISPANRLVHLVPPNLSPSPPLYSSSVESVVTPPESHSSFLQLMAWDGKKIRGVEPVETVDLDSTPMVSLTTTATPTNKTSISYPIPINTGTVQFPQLPNTSSTRQAKRISIPFLSLPNFSPGSLTPFSDVDRPKDDDSPCSSPTSGAASMLSKRSKQPSLRLLFSKNKKSGSSLNSIGERSGGSGNGIPFISIPIPQYPLGPDFSGKSDSSDSTPLSAVTAPSGMSSRSHLPPVLDTPIENCSLSLGSVFDISPAALLVRDDGIGEQQALAKVGVGESVASPTPTTSMPIPDLEALTPMAGRISNISAPPTPFQATLFPIPSYPALLTEPPRSSSSLSVSRRPALSLEIQSSFLGFSISPTPSPQLSLLDDGEEDEEDWTQSVLSAADRLS